MKSINLRLTDEQHAKLVEEAHENRRSLQREIVWRIEHHDGSSAAVMTRTFPASSVVVAARPFRGPDEKPKPKAKATRR